MASPASPARPFGAVLTAMITPMTADGAVDLDAAARLATYLVDQGNDGLVVSGTTGESGATHAPEKADLVRAVVAAVGDRARVVAGAGSNDTDHAVRMAEQAAEAGAHGLLVVTPYYTRPTQDGLYQHFAAVAGSTDLPVMLYDVPGRTGLRIGAGTLDRIAAHDNVVAVKDATGDVATVAAASARTGLAWYCGDDSLYLAMLAQGAVGLVGVATHALAPQYAALTAAWDAADHARALEIMRSVLPVVDAFNGAGAQAVMAKAAAEVLGVISSRAMRLPNVPASDAETAAMRDALAAAGVLDPARPLSGAAH
ncbi:dihydrodipicolinate synthase [Sediminihabitans luteus]|uniref:4-hydroxy-tetrahydrodipicolinate synthase n=1 Tax=Sediminihabitans luteus TaxID=1138585 RepID=A0A2M9CCF9_9CELL|nr:4-hydroxy-tetrahydrodipicolinate synthase [Sediminihabitans luteus]PJJ69029.1 dihydrodipicolinate synthase [Sediminihabitans luteus]GII99415.1 4-hydroxy-tetrahydrodipicolinate synthase 2 [Sediminihabitans luteus]